MAISYGVKATVTCAGVAGTALPPLLSTYVDAKAAAKSVEAGEIGYPEAYPLHRRVGIVAPLATGIPTLLLGLFGDKLLEGVIKDPVEREGVQLGLLFYGTTATTGGTVELARALEARKAIGVDPISPDPKADTKAYAAMRTIAYYALPAKPAGAFVSGVKAVPK